MSVCMAKRKQKSTVKYKVAATVFAIVCFVHALRLAQGWPLVLGEWQAPMWLSWLAVFLTGSLAVLLWQNGK